MAASQILESSSLSEKVYVLEDVCCGMKACVCDPDCLVEINETDVVKAALDKLNAAIKDVLNKIQSRRQVNVAEYCIGMGAIRTQRKEVFDPMNPKTWNKEDIYSKWKKLSDNEEGENADGLIVLSAITKESISTSFSSEMNQKRYASALLQHLTHMHSGDERFFDINDLPATQSSSKISISYGIYIAFTLCSAPNNEIVTFQPILKDLSKIYLFNLIIMFL